MIRAKAGNILGMAMSGSVVLSVPTAAIWGFWRFASSGFGMGINAWLDSLSGLERSGIIVVIVPLLVVAIALCSYAYVWVIAYMSKMMTELFEERCIQ